MGAANNNVFAIKQGGVVIMRSKMKLYYLLAGFWAMAGVLMGAVYHVAMPSAGGDDVNSGLDWANPKASISNALAQGDVTEILVSNGMYQLADIVSVSKAVHIRSWNNGAIDRDGTIMVGAGTKRCLRISHAGGIVDGFTITNGFSQDGVLQSGDSTSTAGRGGGVFITHSGGLLTNCLIIGNTVKAGANYKGGGGVFLMGGAIWNCRITGNIVTNDNASSAMGGGVGVYLYDTSGYPTSMVVNCEIDNNNIYRGITYNNGGGGVGVYRAALIDNCDIYGNSSGAGGGLLAHTRGVTTITNTRIFNNNSEGRAGGIFVMKTEDDHGVRITDCLISNNTATSASSLGGGIFVDGNSTNVLIYNCMIVDNKSGLDGGGAYIAAGVVHGGIVSNNSCHGSNAGGGGLYLGPNKTNMVFIRDVRIVNNRAKADGAWGGGGVMMVNTWLENCFIANNHAIGCRGGGVYAHLTNTVVSCTILNNTADMYGGEFMPALLL